MNIPDFPRIKIKDYVSKLSNKIRVLSDEDFNITENSLEIISKKLNYSTKTLKTYIRHKKYPLFFIKELNKLLDKNIFYDIENSETSFISKWKVVNLPKYLTPRLAYFVGYLQGDGSIQSNKKRMDFTDEDSKQIEMINELCLDLFNIEGRIYSQDSRISKKPMYRLDIGSLVLNSYLHKIFGINRGKKHNLRIPNIFKNNREILRWYLVGLFDADGTLPKNPDKCKQLFVDITLKDKEFIEELKSSLKLFDIHTLKPYCRVAKSPTSDTISKTWELRIRKKDMIIRFLNEVGFSHPVKSKRAEKLLQIYAPG